MERDGSNAVAFVLAFLHRRNKRQVLYPPFCIAGSRVCNTERRRSTTALRQELVERDWEVADTDAGCVIDGIGK